MPMNPRLLRPLATLDPDVSAFRSASGATNVNGLNRLAVYLKGQSLWDYARFYPMKSAQNAGSGSTVYGLGGLTSNNMTLVNSPTWGSDGVTFDKDSSHAGEISDFLGSATVSMWWRGTPVVGTTTLLLLLSQYDFGASQRSIQLTLDEQSNNELRLFRSSDGGSPNMEQHLGTTSISGDTTVSAEWVDGGGRSAWVQKQPETLSLDAGLLQTTRLNVPAKITLMSNLSSGSLVNFSSATCVFAGFIETALTTTQRETITDLINAL